MPQQKDGITLSGCFTLVHMRDGEVIGIRENIKNLITNAGMAEVAALLLTDVASDDFDEIAIGTGTTAAAAGDTALEAEISTNGGERKTGGDVTGSRVTTDVANDTAQLVCTFNFTGSFAVTEAGVFNDPSAGDMLCRQVFSAVNVANGDSLQVTWQIDVD